MPTRLVAIALPETAGATVDEVARRLRLEDPAVVARIERNALILDPRTVQVHEDVALIAAIKHVLSEVVSRT